MTFLALFIVFAIPPAAKTLIVIGAVFAILQAAKLSPWLATYVVNGWKAVVLNVLLTACGILIAVPASNLYTINTFVLVITSVLGSAGIHGTKVAFSTPRIAAVVPPSTTPVQVEAHLEPNNPAAIPTDVK